ncbi:MAG: UDP-2,3-diacylglucosamine diphosphatase [Bacteroidales bacterium]|nr:UDP-2,3-diacylglucosamine diphosphatase [Bacteroidales bacterium]
MSDSHLGIPNYHKSLEREKILVKWLDDIKSSAQEIYLLGDIFDFWFEYKHVVPRGYVRLFGKLAELSDSGISINYFIGNHDMWIKNYFEEQLALIIYKEPILCKYNEKIFFIGHGDGLGNGDLGYKFIKKIFSNKILQWLFSWIHPSIAFRIALFFSRRSRLARGDSDMEFKGCDNERLFRFAKEIAEKVTVNYFVFGHRHLPLEMPVKNQIIYYNIGDWFNHFTYLVFDGENMELKKYI